MYVDFEYYSGIYGGSLSEEDFQRAEPKAEAQIRYLTFANGDIFAKQSFAVMDAVCVAAELISEAAKTAASASSTANAAGIKSESNDGYSVTYITDAQDGQTADQALRRRILEAVRVYLLPTGWLRRRVPCRCD